MKVKIEVDGPMYEFLKSLLKTGLYGKSINEVVKRLLNNQLGDMLTRREIPDFGGRKGPQKVTAIPSKEGA